MTTKATRCGGIGSIINNDALGLDAVYIQARRYAATISRPDIQQFIVSLTREGASKGMFVTTSDFSRQAWDFLQRVMVINGQRLAQLMITHGVGVHVRQT